MMGNPFAPNMGGMMQQMMGGMMQQAMGGMMHQAMGNMPPIMQLLANPAQAQQKYREFCSQYKGNPEEDVRRLMSEGRINDQQLQQLKLISAQMFPNF